MSLDPQQPNLDQLIQDVKRGLTALDELMAWAREWLRAQMDGRPYGVLRARFDESDVVGEALVKVIENLRTFKGHSEAEFRVWLKQIAQNKLYDLAGQHRASMRDPGKEQHIDCGPDSADPSGQDLPSRRPVSSRHEQAR